MANELIRQITITKNQEQKTYDIRDDTKIPNPEQKQEGQVLKYDGTNWVADNAPASGLVLVQDQQQSKDVIKQDDVDVTDRVSAALNVVTVEETSPTGEISNFIKDPAVKQEGQVLKYSGGQWIASSSGGGSSGYENVWGIATINT